MANSMMEPPTHLEMVEMTSERDPTVIERMASAYTKSAIGVPLDGLLNSDKICENMIAAVRELEETLRFKGRIYAAAAIGEIVREYENSQMSKSDMPPSHTNPPSE